MKDAILRPKDKTVTGTIKGLPRHVRFMFLIAGLTVFKNNLSLLTTTPGGGDGSRMSITALRVSSAVLLQSNRNIMLHFNGLSWFVPVAESIASLHSPNMSVLFYEMCLGSPIKDSVLSLCALN